MDKSGFDVDIFTEKFKAKAENFLCEICKGVLNNPMITRNGCEFCQDCILKGIELKGSSLQCQRCFNEKLTKSNIYFSKRTTDYICSWTTKCPNSKNLFPCTWQGTVLNYYEHVTNCPMDATHCVAFDLRCCFDNCNGTVLRKDKEKHPLELTVPFLSEKIQTLNTDNDTLKSQLAATLEDMEVMRQDRDNSQNLNNISNNMNERLQMELNDSQSRYLSLDERKVALERELEVIELKLVPTVSDNSSRGSGGINSGGDRSDRNRDRDNSDDSSNEMSCEATATVTTSRANGSSHGKCYSNNTRNSSNYLLESSSSSSDDESFQAVKHLNKASNNSNSSDNSSKVVVKPVTKSDTKSDTKSEEILREKKIHNWHDIIHKGVEMKPHKRKASTLDQQTTYSTTASNGYSLRRERHLNS